MSYGSYSRKVWVYNKKVLNICLILCLVCVVINGYLSCFFSDQLPVSTKFDMRSDPGVVRNYGKLLVEMVSIVPDGVVCFFVSYSYMDGIIATWNETGILKVRCLLFFSLLCYDKFHLYYTIMHEVKLLYET